MSATTHNTSSDAERRQNARAFDVRSPRAGVLVNVASVVVRPGNGRSDVHRVRGSGPLRVMCPRLAGNAAWIVTSSLGGGLVDGDHVTLEVEVDPGATCLVTTQASTKAYRGTSQQHLNLQLRGDATALVVPDPIVPYRDARFTQRTTIALAPEASLALCDTLTAGRIAFGERWSALRLDSTLALSIGGESKLVDRIVLDPCTSSAVAARMRRFEALATVLLVGPRFRDLARAELARERKTDGVVVAGSPFADGALFRIAGERVELVTMSIRHLLRDACSQVGEDPWARKW
jgi:urease accessory protein